MHRAIHLTNDAVQKDMPHYGTFEENNKLSMAQLQAALGDQVRGSNPLCAVGFVFIILFLVCMCDYKKKLLG